MTHRALLYPCFPVPSVCAPVQGLSCCQCWTELEGLMADFPKLKQLFRFPAGNPMLQKVLCWMEQLLPALSFLSGGPLSSQHPWLYLSMGKNVPTYVCGAHVGWGLPFPETLRGVVEVLHLPSHFWGLFCSTQCHMADGSICPCCRSHSAAAKDEIAHSRVTDIAPEDKSRSCLIWKQKQTKYFHALDFGRSILGWNPVSHTTWGLQNCIMFGKQVLPLESLQDFQMALHPTWPSRNKTVLPLALISQVWYLVFAINVCVSCKSCEEAFLDTVLN